MREIFAILKLSLSPPKVQVPASVRMLESFGMDTFQRPKCKHGRMAVVATYRREILVKTYEDKYHNIQNKDPAA